MAKSISVVIPTYNRKDILKKTLLSFVNQSSDDFEIVVSDDGSTDGTGEMIKNLKVPYSVKHVWNKNSGRSTARNNGVKACEGKIILFVDDHIIVDRRLIEEHLNYHNKFKNTNICTIKGRVEFIDDINEAPKETEYIPEAKIRRYPGEQNPLRIFYTNNISVRKEALQKVGGFDEDFKEYGFQDQELGYRLRKAGYKFKFNPNAVGYIFSVKSSFEKKCEKMREAGHSAVIFFRKHPYMGFFQVGVNPINTLLYFLLSLNDNWWLRKAKSKLSKASFMNSSMEAKWKSRIKYFYFLQGMHEVLFKGKNLRRKTAKDKRTILLVSHQSDLSGAPISLYLLSKYLDKTKYHVIFTTPENGPLLSRLEAAGIETIVTGNFFKTYRLFKLIKDRDVDLLHANTATSTFGALAGKLARIPIIWHIRENLKGKYLLLKLINLLSDKIIILSKDMKSYFKGIVSESKIEVIPNGVELNNYKNIESVKKIKSEFKIDSSSLIVGTMGSLEPRKGTEYFIRAASFVKREIPEAKFFIVGKSLPGKSRYKKKMEQLAINLKVRDDIIFTGPREDATEILALFDVFVLPSLWEGMSRVILEAMACGKPVVATKVGGNPELIVDGETGVLIPPRDTQKLANAIKFLLSNRSKAQEIGEKAKERVRTLFSLERCTKNIEEIYDELSKVKT